MLALTHSSLWSLSPTNKLTQEEHQLGSPSEFSLLFRKTKLLMNAVTFYIKSFEQDLG